MTTHKTKRSMGMVYTLPIWWLVMGVGERVCAWPVGRKYIYEWDKELGGWLTGWRETRIVGEGGWTRGAGNGRR